MKVAVSACLVGNNTRWDGKNNYNQKVIEYLKDKEYITICPEVFGGMSTPRDPSEIKEDKVISINGIDVTNNFLSGANKALKMILDNNISEVILKESSPSCGSHFIYDGTFKGIKIEGQGILVRMLKEKGIKVLSEKDIEKL